MDKLRKTFWTKSKQLINWCTNDELVVLKSSINKELNARIEVEQKKYFKPKKFKETK